LTGNGASEDAEPRRLALASDLRWLINEGYLIEFNDGHLITTDEIKAAATCRGSRGKRHGR
jgi:hypothetical protein